MTEKLHDAVISNDYVVFGDTDPDIVTFSSSDVGFDSINLNNINLDENNFEDCAAETIMLDSWLGIIDTSNTRHVKKDRLRIIACNKASNKNMGLVHLRRYEKK